LESDVEHWIREAEDRRLTVIEQQEMLQVVEDETTERLRSHQLAREKAEREHTDLVRQLNEQIEEQKTLHDKVHQLQEQLAAAQQQQRISIDRAEALQTRLDELGEAEESLRAAAQQATHELEAAREEAASNGVREADWTASQDVLREQATHNEQLQAELDTLKGEHAALSNEYAKLQNEYNEWIDLLEQT
jgi:chromosome segregation ATPase